MHIKMDQHLFTQSENLQNDASCDAKPIEQGQGSFDNVSDHHVDDHPHYEWIENLAQVNGLFFYDLEWCEVKENNEV